MTVRTEFPSILQSITGEDWGKSRPSPAGTNPLPAPAAHSAFPLLHPRPKVCCQMQIPIVCSDLIPHPPAPMTGQHQVSPPRPICLPSHSAASPQQAESHYPSLSSHSQLPLSPSVLIHAQISCELCLYVLPVQPQCPNKSCCSLSPPKHPLQNFSPPTGSRGTLPT